MSAPEQVQDREYTSEELREIFFPRAAMNISQYELGEKIFDEFVRRNLTYGIDYGPLPEYDQDGLWKPGAEKILKFFSLVPRYSSQWREADAETGLYSVQYECQLMLRDSSPVVVGSGCGVCSSYEKSFRYRKKWWNRNGDPPAAEDWERTRKGKWFQLVTNPNLIGEWNSVDKKSQKRGMVAAILTISAASEKFTHGAEGMNASVARQRAQGRATKTVSEDHPWPAEKIRKTVASHVIKAGESESATRKEAGMCHSAIARIWADDKGQTKRENWLLQGLFGVGVDLCEKLTGAQARVVVQWITRGEIDSGGLAVIQSYARVEADTIIGEWVAQQVAWKLEEALEADPDLEVKQTERIAQKAGEDLLGSSQPERWRQPTILKGTDNAR